MDSQKYPIQVCLYQLQKDPNLYYSTIKAYNREFFMLRQIAYTDVTNSYFGNPIEVIDFDNNYYPFEIFLKHLEDNLDSSLEYIDNACFKFVQFCLNFLVGVQDGRIQEWQQRNSEQQQAHLQEIIILTEKDEKVSKFGKSAENLLDQFLGQLMGKFQVQQSAKEQYMKNKGDSKVVEIKTLMELVNLTENNDKVIIDCSADWCVPCYQIKPLYDQLSLQYLNINFVTLDIDESKEIASNLGVKSIPAFFCFSKTNLYSSFTGANEDQLRQKVQELANE